MKFLVLVGVIFLSFVFLNPSSILAQTSPSQTDQFIDISSIPANPSPGDSVTVKVESFIDDLNYANILWTVNGQNFKEGMGVTSITTILPASASSVTVTAQIHLKDGLSVARSITLAPSTIDILWQPLTSSHPFYRGLPLFTHQSGVMFVAVPSFSTSGLGSNVAYKWSIDGEVDSSQSGFGKNYFVYNDSILSKEHNVHVEVMSPGGQISEKYFNIKAMNPKVSTYLNNPLLGILFNNALSGKVSLPEGEFTLRAVPYFYSNDSLPLTWYINGERVSDFNGQDLLLTKNKGTGEAFIKVLANDSSKILQNAGDSFNIEFTND